MSLELFDSNVIAKTFPAGIMGEEDVVYLRSVDDKNEINITMSEFCELVLYVLLNTDLKNPDVDSADADPRIVLQQVVSKLQIVDGYNGGKSKRLA